jgi:uncharacterized protein YyaL (SSP411 family)
MAQLQLNNIKGDMPSYGSGYSNWAILMLNYIAPFYEVAIVGTQAVQKALDFKQHYAPNTLLLGSTTDSPLTLLQNKMLEGQTTFYLCQNKSCQLPTTELKKVLNLMQ